MKSYAAEVMVAGESKWTGNAVRFATKAEAQAYVQDLAFRWTAVNDTRVVESEDAVNYAWVNGSSLSLEAPAPRKTPAPEAAQD
jgi:hypothetical protein